MIKRSLFLIIKIYQSFISPLLGPKCRFRPTCSDYAIEAIDVHGVVKGCFYSLLRILRCNPLFKGGFDPVKPKKERENL